MNQAMGSAMSQDISPAINRSIVLIVEDDRDLREALVDTLQASDCYVVAAENGEAAMKVLATQHVDLVCSDVNMPGMNGIQLLQKIQQEIPSMPVILMTAYGSIEHSVSAMHKGASDYLVKPFRAEVFVSVIAKYLNQGVICTEDLPVAEEPSSKQLLRLAAKVAATDATVLITGESGTGKEVLARYIHNNSPRNSSPFVAINCAAIPENMLEATLFGYEKGAFTGAHVGREGKFELANGGTILLDEISEMDLGLQAKLLRVLQEREVERLGGRENLKLNVRVIATSNRDLKKCAKEGTFREDLYYRLSVFPMRWLPLRERRDDILPIAYKVMGEHCRKMGRKSGRFDKSAENALRAFDWPGNVRELDNTIQRALVIQDQACLTAADLSLDSESITGIDSLLNMMRPEESESLSPSRSLTPKEEGGRLDSDLKQREFDVILKTLRQNRGKRKKTAEILGISARTLRYKIARMREFGIDVEGLLEI
ncbi:MAG: two-component system response regulator FlrC [Pseudohongiellaceae bacterium]|jgi:two-component system response regulator FlrC